jgi:hypothetical protein
MTAERLNWQGRDPVLKCRRFIITFEGCTWCPFPCLEEDDGQRLEVQKLFYNVVVSLLPSKDLLCIPLLCLEEDDGRKAELAMRAEAVLK